MNDSIPSILIDNIKTKNVILFTGAGFTHNAVSDSGTKPPNAQVLGRMLSERFLGRSIDNKPLSFIADLAISEANLFEVQNYIHDLLTPFNPNEQHLLYTTFGWKAIFTTNYDLIIERAYQKSGSKSAQDLSTVYRNTSEQQIFKSYKTVPYYKLHGCISYINDPDLPLVLSTEQYIGHRKHRDRLYKKLEELVCDFSILFVGFSNEDNDIRVILNSLENLKDGRPRSFMVCPSFESDEVRYWEGRKITPIQMGYQEFILEVNSRISVSERILSTVRPTTQKPVYAKFQVDPNDLTPSDGLVRFLDYESDFVFDSMPSKGVSPKAFYKGYFYDWDPIIKDLDVVRNIHDSVLSDIILEDCFQDTVRSFLFVIKGFAGSGKSVCLKRLAWEASVTFNKPCFFIHSHISIRPEPIIELANFIKERLYIFVDNAGENERGIIDLLTLTNRERIPISIISAERINILNETQKLESFLDKTYVLNYLQINEIDKLIEKLEEHNSLGYLANKSFEERRSELSEKTGRVLLVALYEATGGKPFEEIILDEYNKINDESAKSLYLTVSVFHRLGTEIRAGLISRVHGISFNDFKDSLFKPLEFIVFDDRNYRINDYVYRTRHPYIAQMVFEMVLNSEQSRYDEYIRILTYLDIDYQSDIVAFLSIVNARKLIEIFKDPIRIRNIFDLAEEKNPDNPKLLQQRAIFEMNSRGGSLYTAEKLLKQANELATNDLMIGHSLVEVTIKKAEASVNRLERSQLLDQASKICKQLIKRDRLQPYAYHSSLKLALIKFNDLINNDNEAAVENKIKDIEKLLWESKNLFPDHEFILEIEARFNEIINNEPKAMSLLKRAHEINPASPYISLRLSTLLYKQGEIDQAKNILKETINVNPNEREVNFKYAYYLSKSDTDNLSEAIHHFRRSFTLGDTRYQAHFWYARALYLSSDFIKAKEIFKELSMARVAPNVKDFPRGHIKLKNELMEFEGDVIVQEETYGFIRRDKYGDEIFIFRSSEIGNWDQYKIDRKVGFSIAFNYKGPIAVNTRILF